MLIHTHAHTQPLEHSDFNSAISFLHLVKLWRKIMTMVPKFSLIPWQAAACKQLRRTRYFFLVEYQIETSSQQRLAMGWALKSSFPLLHQLENSASMLFSLQQIRLVHLILADRKFTPSLSKLPTISIFWWISNTFHVACRIGVPLQYTHIFWKSFSYLLISPEEFHCPHPRVPARCHGTPRSRRVHRC